MPYNADDQPLGLRRHPAPVNFGDDADDDDDDDRPLSHHVRNSSAASSLIMSHAPKAAPYYPETGIRPPRRDQYQHQRRQSGMLPPGAAADPRHSVYSLNSLANSPGPTYHDDGGHMRGSSSTSYFGDYKDVEVGRSSTYDDFNGVGPRRSFALDSHGALPSPDSASQQLLYNEKAQDLDHVADPVLGKDWTDGEAKREHETKRKTIVRERKQKVGEFARGQRKLCGWLSWRHVIFIVLAALIGLGLTLFFTIPRTPELQYDTQKPLDADGRDAVFLHVPGNFSFTGNLNLAVDARSNWLPLAFSSFTVNVKETSTNTNIGRGSMSGGSSVPGRAVTPISVPITFSYASTNDTDPTWQAIYQACKHIWPGQPARIQMSLRVLINMAIRGKIGTTEVGTTIAAFNCPFELAGTA